MGRWRTHNNHRRRLTELQIDRMRMAVEDRVYAEQAELIDTTYGKRASDNANYGWGVTSDADHIDIATKIYVEGRPVLRSIGYYKTGKIIHDWAA